MNSYRSRELVLEERVRSLESMNVELQEELTRAHESRELFSWNVLFRGIQLQVFAGLWTRALRLMSFVVSVLVWPLRMLLGAVTLGWSVLVGVRQSLRDPCTEEEYERSQRWPSVRCTHEDCVLCSHKKFLLETWTLNARRELRELVHHEH